MFRKLMTCAAAFAAFATTTVEARTDKITVHGPSLEGNLEGNSPDREVLVFLPPGYDSDSDKRYPVIYFLHGYSASAASYDERANFQEAVDAAAAAGNELIMVVPDAHTKFKGAMYSPSVTTGDFRQFVAVDLVSHIDQSYRTLAQRESRGLSGHSMGGYGTFRVAMAHPGIFSSIYAMAPCCLQPTILTAEQVQSVTKLTPEQIAAAKGFDLVVPALLSAWAPDPQNPQFHFSTTVRDGKVDPLLTARLAANSPLVLLPQYLPALNSLQAIAIDVGDKDELVLQDGTLMHKELNRFGIAHEWEIFDGDHINRVPARIRSDLLPFFAKHLVK